MGADNNRLKGNLNQFDGRDKQQRIKLDELNQQMLEQSEKLRLANKEKVIESPINFSSLNNHSHLRRICA